jgi:hypothetical protein
MSFDSPGEYSTLMSNAPAVERTLLAALAAWGHENGPDGKPRVRSSAPFWARLAGSNSYCQLGGDPDRQSRDLHKTSGRYRVLNFCHGLHGTLECRVLGMFKSPELSIAAVALVVATMNAQLATLPKAKSLTAETTLGPVTCRIWKAGYRLSLQAAPAVRLAAKAALFPRGAKPAATDKVASLAYRLLVKDYVCENIASLNQMATYLDAVTAKYSVLAVTVAAASAPAARGAWAGELCVRGCGMPAAAGSPCTACVQREAGTRSRVPSCLSCGATGDAYARGTNGYCTRCNAARDEARNARSAEAGLSASEYPRTVDGLCGCPDCVRDRENDRLATELLDTTARLAARG